MAKGNMSIATKIAIQINCKIGGAPWTVPVPVQVRFNFELVEFFSLRFNTSNERWKC